MLVLHLLGDSEPLFRPQPGRGFIDAGGEQAFIALATGVRDHEVLFAVQEYLIPLVKIYEMRGESARFLAERGRAFAVELALSG